MLPKLPPTSSSSLSFSSPFTRIQQGGKNRGTFKRLVEQKGCWLHLRDAHGCSSNTGLKRSCHIYLPLCQRERFRLPALAEIIRRQRDWEKTGEAVSRYETKTGCWIVHHQGVRSRRTSITGSLYLLHQLLKSLDSGQRGWGSSWTNCVSVCVLI